MDEPSNFTMTKVTEDDLNRAILQLQRTLDHFKTGRGPLQAEKEELWKLLKSGIPLYDLTHAISGMRYEPKTMTYDPGRHISIFKLWDKERRIKLLTLSTQEQKRLEDLRNPQR